VRSGRSKCNHMALHGVIVRVQDLGLELVEIRRLGPERG
jgi:hypothetical protein